MKTTYHKLYVIFRFCCEQCISLHKDMRADICRLIKNNDNIAKRHCSEGCMEGLGSLWLGRRWPLYRTHSVREGMESFFLSYSPSRDSFIHFLVWSLPAPTITITSENLKVFIQCQANSEFGLSTGNQGALVNGQYRMASKAFSLVQTSRDNPPSH